MDAILEELLSSKEADEASIEAAEVVSRMASSSLLLRWLSLAETSPPSLVFGLDDCGWLIGRNFLYTCTVHDV